MKKLALCIIIIFLISGLSFAQAKLGQFAPFVALSLPAGDFGDDKTQGDGYATTGFGAGLDYAHPIGTPGLTWFSTVAFLYNGFDDSGIQDLAADAGVTNISVDAGSWINIPVLTGLRYETEISPTMDFFALGQIGLDFYMPPNSDITFDGGTATAEIDGGTAFTFGLGAGVVFNDKFNASFRYLSMGEPELEMTVTSPGGSETLASDTGISVILITVGMYLQ